jgi:acetyl-CoA acetyltransferase
MTVTSFPSRRAAIVGVYTTEMARRLPRTGVSLQIEAIKGALADAGLEPNQVDGVVPLDERPVPDAAASVHMFWAEQFGERPLTYLDQGIASGGLAKAAAAVSAGLARVVVLFYGKAGWQVGPGGPAPTTTRAPRSDEWGFEPHGAYMSVWYAMWTRRYMHEFGATEAGLAQVRVTHRYHATLNPDSLMGHRGEITVDEVLNSRYIAEPLHLLDCSLDNDGGYALVVAAEDIARDTRKPVWILGGAEAAYTDFYMTINKPWFPEGGKAVRRTAERAFAMSGVRREDIDVAGLYDCFSVTMLRDLEELGFCGVGEGVEYFREGHTRLGGSMPCNTDGGLLSNSHVGNPSGLHTIEVVRQLRDECGARQVPGARIGLSLAQGYAVHGMAGTLIMASD